MNRPLPSIEMWMPASCRRPVKAMLVHSGHSPEELAREFEPSAQSIRNWVGQADRDEGRSHDGLTDAEREELRRLRRENRQLRQEREILAKAATWFAQAGRLDPVRVFEFVRANRAMYPVATMCRLLGISASGYDAWQGRAPSASAVLRGEFPRIPAHPNSSAPGVSCNVSSG